MWWLMRGHIPWLTDRWCIGCRIRRWLDTLIDALSHYRRGAP